MCTGPEVLGTTSLGPSPQSAVLPQTGEEGLVAKRPQMSIGLVTPWESGCPADPARTTLRDVSKMEGSFSTTMFGLVCLQQQVTDPLDHRVAHNVGFTALLDSVSRWCRGWHR